MDRVLNDSSGEDLESIPLLVSIGPSTAQSRASLDELTSFPYEVCRTEFFRDLLWVTAFDNQLSILLDAAQGGAVLAPY
ncbi:hypothetical protein C496_14216 [Natronorubrum tibetense GA33]|uniref:Uncharacterized protein n=1 Tax=Natronorubrum tibetense GA33 TaxID=1114856 RepID=L9VRP8_9EURY|nr:hypothetical protein C496_14216 [Natronorubrum tibetense GA33]